MKPDNVNEPYLLSDGEPVHCSFMARADAPVFWERCEQWATWKGEQAGGDDIGEAVRFRQYLADHPKAIIMLYPGPLYLCDTHLDVMRECC